MVEEEGIQALRGIDEKTRKILGLAIVEDQGWDVGVLLANKTFALPDEQVDSWTTRPAVLTDRLGGLVEPGPLVRGSSRLHIFRGFRSERESLSLARIVELIVQHSQEEEGFHWVYSVILYQGPSGIPTVETACFKDRALDECRSPLLGHIPPGTDLGSNQLRAFNEFLEYALKVKPVISSWHRYRLGL